MRRRRSAMVGVRRWQSMFMLVALLAIALLLILSCGPGFMDGLTGGRLDASADADNDANTDAGGRACEWAVPPDPPTAQDTPENIELTFAVDELRIDNNPLLDSGLEMPRGLNQDERCTCPEEESCIRLDASTLAKVCDGDGGRDNALSAFFSTLGLAVPELNEEFATKRIRDGLYSIIFDVFGWNGTDEDPTVVVRMRLSLGMDPDGGRLEPLLDGQDLWTVDPGTIVEGQALIGEDCRFVLNAGRKPCTPTIIDTRAYVSKGLLVAHLQEVGTGRVPIVLRTREGALNFELYETTIVARIIKNASTGKYRLVGELAGRWPASSMLATVGNIENPIIPGAGLCTSGEGGVYASVKANLCGALDLAAAKKDDRTGVRCGAISGAFSFGAGPALVGHVRAEVKQDAGCANWKDDCTN